MKLQSKDSFWIPERQGMATIQVEYLVSNLNSNNPGSSILQTYSAAFMGKKEIEIETYWVTQETLCVGGRKSH